MDANKDSNSGPRGWAPGLRVRAEVVPPSSKSHAIRALLAAGFATGTTRLSGLSQADDVCAAIEVVAGGGARVSRHGSTGATIEGLAPELWRPAAPLDVGESGTLARLVTAALALCPVPGTPSNLVARGSLCERSSVPLLRALREAGATLEPASARSSWPLEIVSCAPPQTLRLEDPVSSQELSGLLLALATSSQPRRIELSGALPSRPYALMTIEVLRSFGASVEEVPGGFEVYGPLTAPAGDLVLEPDASAAAVALAAACLGGGATRVRGYGQDSLQGDVAIAEHLRAFGCAASFEHGELRAGGFPLHGARLDLHGEPDLAPVLAAVAGAVALRGSGERARSRLDGLETLNAKECPRLDVLAETLQALGLEVQTTESSLSIGPGRPTEQPLVLDPRGDHRMAFAFALLGLVRPGLTARDPGCVAKSWPDFWQACTEHADPGDSSAP